VAGDPTAAHAHDDHVLDAGPVGQALQAVRFPGSRLHLLGEGSGDLPHALGVEGERHRAYFCSNVGLRPSEATLAMMRSCSAPSTVSASSISITGMSSRMRYLRVRRGL